MDLHRATLGQIRNAVNCVYRDRPASFDRETIVEDVLSLQSTVQVAATAVATVSRAVSSLAADAGDALTDGLADIVGDVASGLADVVSSVQRGIAADLAAAQKATTGLVATVTGAVGNVIDTAADTLSDLTGAATDALGNAIEGAGRAVASTVNAVTGAVGGVIGRARDLVGRLVADASAALGRVIEEANGAIRTAVGAVADTAADVVGGAGNFLAEVFRTVRDRLADLIGNIQTGVAGLVEQLTGLPAALIGAAGTLAEQLGPGILGLPAALAGLLADPLGGIIGGFFHAEEPNLLRLVDRLYDRALANPALDPAVRDTIVAAKVGGRPVPAIVAAVLLPILLGALISGSLQPAVQLGINAENANLRPTTLGLGDLVTAVYRGRIDTGYLAEQGGRLGVADRDLDIVLDASRPQPTVGELIEWLHRGTITEAAFLARVEGLGFTPADARAIRSVAPVLPGVADVVRFVVREALPGQSAFGGAAGASVPGAFVELAGKLGLEADAARSFWAAHWELPSVGQVFEMYHRGIVTREQLDTYLVVADVMPEWRDRLVAVAFDPLTRVDVRRMFGLGVLSGPEVERAYRDLGYSPENARRLREFVERDAAADTATKPDPERDLTRADLIGAYADGLLTRPEASAHLGALGFSDDEVRLLLDREDYRATKAERKAERAAIIDAASAGALTTEQVQDRLAALGYTADEIGSAVREIARARAALVKAPTKAELDRFRRFGKLTTDEYKVELRALGYAERWVEMFASLPVGATPNA